MNGLAALLMAIAMTLVGLCAGWLQVQLWTGGAAWFAGTLLVTAVGAGLAYSHLTRRGSTFTRLRR